MMPADDTGLTRKGSTGTGFMRKKNWPHGTDVVAAYDSIGGRCGYSGIGGARGAAGVPKNSTSMGLSTSGRGSGPFMLSACPMGTWTARMPCSVRNACTFDLIPVTEVCQYMRETNQDGGTWLAVPHDATLTRYARTTTWHRSWCVALTMHRGREKAALPNATNQE
jgi:hypothetical protein